MNQKKKQKIISKKSFLSSFINVHSHRYFRGTFCFLIFLHIISLLIPLDNIAIHIPNEINSLFNYLFDLWPFPTFEMSQSNQLLVRNALFKALEILVLLLYTIDLVPKIFYWNKPLYWKIINIFIVTIMVLQVPLTMIGYVESGISVEKLKIRISSIGLLFILMCEIMSIRERQNFKLNINPRSNKKPHISNELENKKNDKRSKSLKQYSWIEIIKHDRPGDCWVVIHGKVYDLSEFAKKHPGGPMIYDGCGGDCTSMWESYHSVSMTKVGPPQEYVIGIVRDYEDFYSWDGTFYNDVRQRVEKFLPKEKRQNDWRLFIKAAFILIGYFYVTYNFLMNYTFFSAILYSIFASQMGVNVMHDGNHMAFTNNKKLSLMAGYTLDLAFSTSVVYRRSHNFGHHGCVNHYELDRAFDTTFPIFRLHKLQPKMSFHKYQHIYSWLIYGSVNFGDLFGTFDELFWMSNFPTRRGFLTKTSYYSHVAVKLIWLVLVCFIPIYRFGFYEMFPVWVTYMFAFS